MNYTRKKPDLKVPSGSVNHTSRKEFMEDLPSKVRNTLQGVDIALINEATTAITEGRATINGKSPRTRVERYIVIASYFKTARTKSHMFFDGAVDVKDTCTVDIRYHDQSYVLNFPEKHSEN